MQSDALQASFEAVVESNSLPTAAVVRWRKVFNIVRSIQAFSPAQDAETESQNQLKQKLLSSPSHAVINVQPDFAIELTRSKSVEKLHQFGGVKEVALALGTDAKNGIPCHAEAIARRRQDFGSNTTQKPPPKMLHTVLQTLRDPIIILLLLWATLSLCFGVKKSGVKGWSDGVSIFVAVFIVMMVTASSYLWPGRQFFKLSKARDDFTICVIRNGQMQSISVFDAVVGDVVSLKRGDQIPADGLYIDGNSLQVNESNMKPESDSLEFKDDHNPFLFSGTKVANGSARMIVTAVGKDTEWWRTMLSSKCNHSNLGTPLQMKLRKLTVLISKCGLVVASLVLLVLLARYFGGNMHNGDGTPRFRAGQTRFHDIYTTVIGILATPVALASCAIPEGLLLSVTITIAYSTRKMAAQQALVRNLSACYWIGSTTVICTNERGTLTSKDLQVSEFWFGEGTSSLTAQNVRELLREGIVTTNAQGSPRSPIEVGGSEIETALQNWAVQNIDLDIDGVRAKYDFHCLENFHSEKIQSVLCIKKKKTGKKNHMHLKGEPDLILATCSQYHGENGIIKKITESAEVKLDQKIQEMKSKGLRFLGLVGLKYPCPPETREAVLECQNAGINVKMVTSTESLAARAIATECGMIEPNQDQAMGEVVDGLEFRNYSKEERLEKTDKIRVMARASTWDRIHMVRCLKQRGHVVAVTGQSTGDAAVLKEANIGLSLGIQGTQTAKENSDVIILDDTFHSIARVLRWGRGMFYKIQIFTQFQLTISISSLVIDFVTAITSREPPTIDIIAAISVGQVPYATIQVLWVKLIVGALAALALAIEEPPELRQLPPADHNEPFITNIMWRNIMGQAVYPIIVLLTLQFRGESTFNLDAGVKDTMIFTIFVFWQLVIIFNTKGFEINIFKWILREKLFWTVIGIIVLIQIVIVELLMRFAGTKRLNCMQWAACIGIALLAWPMGWLVKRIDVPKKPFFSLSST